MGFSVLLMGADCLGGASPVPSPGTYAPQINYSFPDAGIQDLSEGGSLTFTAAGEDLDSLVLEWEWQLDDAIQVFGESSDGTFDETWTVDWSEEISGFLHDVCFVVRDLDGNETPIYWPIQVE